MNKKILLVGNNDGLPGVKIDLENYKNYFKSKTGGEWREDEIIQKLNPKKDDLINLIDTLKASKLEFLIVIFSGHGGMKRDTVLELNANGELFSESRFKDISKKQVTILDCCRAYLQPLTEAVENMRRVKSFNADSSTRLRFESKIREALPQQIKIYSCAQGECSHDTPKGGAYTKNLLEQAYNDEAEFVYYGRVHVIAAEKTSGEYNDQHPEIILPRLLTSQQLILGIN